MRKTIKSITTIMGFVLTALALAVSAGASTGGFSVSPVMPSNQNPETNGYYDLFLEPGQTQQLILTVNNTSDEEITVSVSAVTATTNSNGIINYADPGAPDETLPYSFEDMAQLSDESLTIPANSSKDVTVSFTMPDEPIDGVILGSIAALKEITDAEKASGGMIVNQFRYVVAVRLQMTDTPIETDFLLGNVSAELVNYRASIVADIRNPQPKIIKEAEVHAQIYPRDSDTAAFEASNLDVGFAPNSIFSFAMTDEAGYGIQAGWYLAKIQVKHEGRTWEFEHEFEILANEAADLNRNSVNQTKLDSNRLPTWAIIAIGAGVLLLIIAIILIVLKARADRKYMEFYKQMEAKASSNDNDSGK